MKVTSSSNLYNNYQSKKQGNASKPQSFSAIPKFSQLSKKAKTSAIAGLMLLPSMGIVVNQCSNKNSDRTIEVSAPVDTTFQSKYLDKGEKTFYVVKSGDIPAKIAEEFDVSTRRLLAQNGMTKKSVIYPNDTLLIPQSYKVKNIKSLEDAAKLTGFSQKYLEDLCKMEKVHHEIYYDRNNRETIGVGHYIKPSELEKYKGVKLSSAQVYTILAQDLVDRDLDMQTFLNEKAFKEMPAKLKESVMDLVFNKGEGAVENNKELLDALNNQDYEKAIANMNQDFSIVTNANGKKVKKPASGLSKRRLYDMQNAAKIFGGDIPKSVLKSAKKVYENGLVCMKAEMERGEISEAAYPNVLAEYKDLAYQWFDGKIGEQLKVPSSKNIQKNSSDKKSNTASDVKKVPQETISDTSKTIYVNGEKTNWTVNSLYQDWEKTAKRQLRYVKRPMPQIDKNGNIKALVKVLEPIKAKGGLAGKTIIINPGHGGAMNYKEKNGTLNVNFDPGTSNAVMSKKNKNLETNNFIANKGKSLEEWVVNQRIADELVEKIRKDGGKVIYVQGSAYSALKAIRNIQSKQKIDMVVSLHSNSAGDSRGIFVIANKRGGEDKKDNELAKVITDKMNEHSWFRGITHKKSQSLGVLSSSANASSPVPGVLIETGNLKNESDVANLNSRTFKSKMIESIFEAMKDYLK